MAHFAEIGPDDKVLRVIVIPNEEEHRGKDFIANDLGLGGTWIQTSYNTREGKHILGGIPLRKNYAGIGFTYDVTRDAFTPPKPYNSWLLNEETCIWGPPVPRPTTRPETGKKYVWDEATVSWIQVPR